MLSLLNNNDNKHKITDAITNANSTTANIVNAADTSNAGSSGTTIGAASNDTDGNKDSERIGIVNSKFTANSDDTIEDGEVCSDTNPVIDEPVAKLNPIYSNSIFTKRYVSSADSKKNEQDIEDGQVDDILMKDKQPEACGDVVVVTSCKLDTDDEIKPGIVNTEIGSNVGIDNVIKVQKEINDESAPNGLLSCEKTDVLSKDERSELNAVSSTEIYDKYPQLSV